MHISAVRSNRDGSGGDDPMDSGEGGVVHNDALGEKGGSAAGMATKGGDVDVTSTDKERRELLLL